MSNLWFAAAIISAFFYGQWKLKKDLQMMQQNSYRNDRYGKWIRANLSRNLRIRDFLPLLAVIPVFFGFPIVGAAVYIAIYGLLFFWRGQGKDKLKLVLTARAKRLFGLTIFLAAMLSLAGFWILFQNNGSIPALTLVFVCLTVLVGISFALLAAGNWLISPLEGAINHWYYRDAQRIIRAMPGLKVIGLTGSFGKTSTKNILTKILASHFQVLTTPGSYNTPMGVTKVIRTMLKPIHEVFVVEMGAKQKGDIKELCDLVSPEMGILTAIGEQHLESFKTLANIKETKFELIEALPQNGLAFFNLDDENVRAVAPQAKVPSVTYGINNAKVDYRAREIQFTGRGMSFTITNPQGESAQIQTRLLGRHNVSNILAGVAVACELGITLAAAARAARDVEPIPHRLELKKTAVGVTIIDDAFNANPVGAMMALEVLQAIPTGRKIIITPGMIELGNREYELNKALAIQAAAACDFIILVGQKQTKPLQDGLQEVGFPADRLYVARDLFDANRRMQSIVQPGDVVLFENDLPDTFNE